MDGGLRFDGVPDSGCYSLVITLFAASRIRIGKLGAGHFPAGTYVYTGSAVRGLAARLCRHTRRKKKLHWHIDYLLASAHAEVTNIIVYPPGQECRQNRKIARRPNARVVLRRFGSSDCKSGCGSHLLFLPK